MMFLVKYTLAALIILLLWFFVITDFSSFHRNGNNQTKKTITNSRENSYEEEKHFSGAFYEYEYKLINEKINTPLLEKKVIEMFSGFEKDYLLSILRKRNQDYEGAYKLLLKNLESKPELFQFYDELVLLGKITGNLNELLNGEIISNSKKNRYLQYLKGAAELIKDKYKNAIIIFNQLIQQGTESPEVYISLANAFRGSGNYEQGIEILLKAESRVDDNNIYLPKILNAIGSLYYLSGKYELAEENYNMADSLALKTGNVREKIISIINLAIIKDVYGDVYGARKDLINVIPVVKEIEDHKLIALLYSELGVNYTYTNNIVEARNNYELSYEYYLHLKNHERLSYLSSNIASIYLEENNYKTALKIYKQGFDLAGENILGKILNLTGMADVFSNMSNYSKAIEYYKRAEQLADSVKDISSLIKIDQGFGALYFNINKPESALKFLKQAENRINESKHPFELTEIYHKTGTVLSSVDSFKQAVYYLSRGLTIAKESGDLYYEIVLQTELGFTYFKSGEILKAINLLSNANELSVQYELTQLSGLQQLYFGKIYYYKGDKKSALSAFNKSVQLANQAADKNTQIESSYYIAQIFESENDFLNAEQWYKKTVEEIEKIAAPLVSNQEIQIAHFTGFSEIYNSLTEFYIKQGRSIYAFENIEKSRSRNTYLNLNHLKISSLIKDEEKLNRFLEISWMISSGLYDNFVTDSLSEEYEKLKNSILKQHPESDAYLKINPWKSLESIQTKLDPGEVFVSIFAADEYIHLFTIKNDGFLSTQIPIGRDSLICLISEIAPIYKADLASEEIYINQDLFSFNARASWNLYNQVFQRLTENILNGSTIIFSFPSELLLLPAEFLVTEWNENDSPFYYKDKHFLVEKFTTMYSPSASVFVTQKSKKLVSNNKNLLFGDPFITSGDFTMSYRSALLEDNNFSVRNIELFPLEYSKQEIENLSDIIAGSTILLSKEATEKNFKKNAPGSRLIHLSTHSFMYKNQPLIIVSQEENSGEDGYIEIDEILDLNLNCDLVVLSSCRSGLGKIDEAEGILGMQKAFFDAGAGSIVVSIWDVNDKYTSFFMEDFYTSLSKGISKPAALREAKLNFIKKYSANPYYWSSFVLAGNPSKMDITASAGNIIPDFVLILILMLSPIFIILYYKRKKRI
jgi:CHAT domain-containing protein/tetratricopeptide (TPR) repeat protein